MAKPTFKVWVVNQVKFGTRIDDPSPRNPYYFTWDQATFNTVVSELKDLFDELCKSPVSKFDPKSDVTAADLSTAAGSLQPKEVIVRLIKKADSAIIRKNSKASGADISGETFDTGSGVISEAWLEGAAGSNNVGELIARLAFHELMHNKYDALASRQSAGKDLHTDGKNGLASGTVAYDTPLTKENKAIMVPALDLIVSQFTAASIP